MILNFRAVKDFLQESFKNIHKISWIIFKYIVPFYILAEIIYYYNLLSYVSFIIDPLANFLSLPPESSIAIISGMFINLYAAIAFAMPLGMSAQEWTIFGMYLGVCHGLLMELAVTKKMGISIWYGLFIRVFVGAFLAFMVSLLPDSFFSSTTAYLEYERVAYTSAWDMLSTSFVKSLELFVVIVLLVAFIILLMDLIKITPWVKNTKKNVSKASVFFVGLVLGLSYGAGILINEAQNKTMSKTDILYMGTFLMIIHAVIEDTLLFVAFGANGWILVGFRLVTAIIVAYAITLLYKKYKGRES